MDEKQVDEIAKVLYEKYCEAVGGKAYNGDDLPDWENFAADEGKKKQVEAWREVSKEVVSWIPKVSL